MSVSSSLPVKPLKTLISLVYAYVSCLSKESWGGLSHFQGGFWFGVFFLHRQDLSEQGLAHYGCVLFLFS